MRLLRILLQLAFLSCLAIGFGLLHQVHSQYVSTTPTSHKGWAVISIIFAASVLAVELYGIYKRNLFAWFLGWGLLAGGVTLPLIQVWQATRQIPERDHPWVAFAASLVAVLIVAAYWGRWWSGQRTYFMGLNSTSSGGAKKVFQVDLGVAAAVFVALAIASHAKAFDTKTAQISVARFHERLAAQQYAGIYADADDDFRKATSEADFVALLQSVHEKLGNVQSTDLRRTTISWGGGEEKYIWLKYDTSFSQGQAIETFEWREDNNEVSLGRYKITSKALESPH